MQRPVIGLHRPREREELGIAPECVGVDGVALRVGLAAHDLGLRARLRGQFDHRPVGRRADPLRGLAAPRALVRRFPLALGPHPRIGRGQVLLGQVGAGQAHVDDADAQRLRLLPGQVADLVHQRRPVLGQDRGRGNRAQDGADRVRQDPLNPALRLLDPARADGAAELRHLDDLPAGERVDHQAAVVQRRHLHRVCLQPKDAGVVGHDGIDQRQLEAEARFLADVDDLAKAGDQRLFADIDDVDRGHGKHRHDDDQRKRDHGKDAAHQLPPVAGVVAVGRPVRFGAGCAAGAEPDRRSWSSGR